jgi:hypothetical protein
VSKTIFHFKEWAEAFYEVYAASFSFSREGKDSLPVGYFDRGRGCYVLMGSPFGDYWPLASADGYEVKKAVNYYRSLAKKKKIKLLIENIPQEQVCYFSPSEILGEVGAGGKVVFGRGDVVVSKKIVNQFNKVKDQLTFLRIYPNDRERFLKYLNILLEYRHVKLNKRKREEYNPSFDKKFDQFILKLCDKANVANHVYLDVCLWNDKKVFCAGGLFFLVGNSLHYYLRSHNPVIESRYSLGLVFDYWFQQKAKDDGIAVVDYGRGDESYKIRLGVEKYRLFSAFFDYSKQSSAK